MLPQVLRAGSMTARSFLPAAWPVAVTYGNSVNNLGLISNGLLAQKGPMQAANQPWRSGYAGAFATNSTSAGGADPAAQMGVDNPAGTVFGAGYVAAHPGMKSAPAGLDVKQANAPESVDADVQGVMRNPVYPKEYVLSVHPKHVEPQKLHQKMALFSITVVRSVFDLATGYNHEKMNETKWLRRMIFLETIAGVPGMVGGMLRHLKSLRRMQRDNGWINTLLEEAENERMHLLTFLEIRKPGPMFRAMVILAQGVMFNMLFMAYLISPKFCHAFVGYLEEEAVKTYTQALKEIDAGKLWPNTPAPAIAKNYWWLGDDATMRDLILAVRADEACHSHVNHTLAELPPDQKNPFLGKDSHLVP